jgi:predicted nuclease of restriction endonuclease-like (RecB) superfamily
VCLLLLLQLHDLQINEQTYKIKCANSHAALNQKQTRINLNITARTACAAPRGFFSSSFSISET